MNKSLLQLCKKRKTTGDQVTALLGGGADSDVVDNDGASALMWACRMSNLSVARALLAAGADVNHKDDYGNTALLWACQTDEILNGMSRLDMRNITIAIVQMLLDFRADKNVRDMDGKTPFQIAVTPKIKEMLQPVRQQVLPRLLPQAQISLAKQAQPFLPLLQQVERFDQTGKRRKSVIPLQTIPQQEQAFFL